MAGTDGWVKFPKAVLTDTMLSPWARLVYAYLVGGQYGDESKSVIATRAQLADAIGCSRPHAERVVFELKNAGLIINLNTGRAAKRPAKWQINKPSYVSPVIQETPSDVSPAVNPCITGDTKTPDRCITGDTPLKNSFKNIIKTHPEDDLLSEAVRMFNARAQAMGLPRVQKLTETRRTQLNARLHDLGGIEGWKALLDRVAQCQFLLGQGPRGWKADFDFLIREESCAKIMEGSYASSTPSCQTTQERNPHAIDRTGASTHDSPRPSSGLRKTTFQSKTLVDGDKTHLETRETSVETEAQAGAKKSRSEVATKALADMRAWLARGKKAG